MARQILIKRLVHEGPNGDRAITKTRYYNYQVCIVDRDSDRELILCEFPGYDHFQSYVQSYVLKDRLAEVQAYAAMLFDFFDYESLPMETYEFRIPTEVKKQWVRVDD